MSASAAQLDVANVAAYLPRMARDQRDVRAILAPESSVANTFRGAATLEYEALSYGELDAMAAELAAGLGEVGLSRGDRVVLMVPPSLPFFALVFGLFQAGVVPVVLDPGMGVERLGKCLARSEPQGFIGIPRAHLARRALGWGTGSLRTNVVVGSFPRLLGSGGGAAGVSLDELRLRGVRRGRQPLAPVSEHDVAAILFTSGSTGVPKGAVYTHGNFLAQTEAIRAMYGIAPGEIDLPTFPLFALFDPALGMTTVVPKMDFTKPGSVDGAQILEPIRRFGVTNMFGSPALLDRVASTEAHRLGGAPVLPTLRRVITAGAPVSARILESFQRYLAPEARIHTPYGATESLPIASIDHRTVLDQTRARTEAGEGICVGHPVPSATVRIVRITDEPRATFSEADLCSPGEVGEICVSGPQVTREYFRDEDNTRLHKMVDERGALFHRVGDVGWRDDDGRIWFCGRKSQRVEIEGRAHFTEQVEGPFNALPSVRRAAFVGPVVGGRVVPTICVEPMPVKLPHVPGAFVPARLREHARARVVERVLVVDRFPVDPRHNAKIHREELRAHCESALARGEGASWDEVAAQNAVGYR
ncbi:MAG: AMP-binding protein [Sandaracinaceae bacterium]|nr:AMP-binding protein [Sandaracinaceae bacterium]